MIDAILEPSKAISDQYGSHQVVTDDGKVYVGRAVEIGDEYYVYLAEADAKPWYSRKPTSNRSRHRRFPKCPLV